MTTFIDALIACLNYDYLATNPRYVKDIAFECIQYHNQHSHHKLLLKLCDMKLIDSEMITELITYNHAQLDLFPNHLIKSEHLLQGKIKSYPTYLKKYHYLMTPQIVAQLLQINFNSGQLHAYARPAYKMSVKLTLSYLLGQGHIIRYKNIINIKLCNQNYILKKMLTITEYAKGREGEEHFVHLCTICRVNG